MKKAKNLLLIFFLIALVVSSILYVRLNSCALAVDLWSAQKETGFDTAVGGNSFGGAKPKDIRATVASVITVFLEFLGIIFIILIIYGGYKYMVSAGESDKVDEALKMIRNAVIGLIIIVASWSIASFVFDCVLDIGLGSAVWMCR